VGAGIEVGSTWDFFAKTWKNVKNVSEKGLKVKNFSKICLKKA
jgi:hypothetical protein